MWTKYDDFFPVGGSNISQMTHTELESVLVSIY